MPWTPIQLPKGPIARSESEIVGECDHCESPDGQPCTSRDCGTHDYDDITGR